MRRNLMNLIRNNRGRGLFRAEAETNTILLYDFIVSSEADAAWFGGVSAEAFNRQLMGMTGDIAVRINSPGGDVFGGQAMFNAMRQYNGGKITAHIDGYAASAASTVALGADEIVMSGAGSMFMIHNAWTFSIGDHRALSADAALLQKIDGALAAQYAEKTGKTVEEIAALMDAETWFSAQESVDIGLATSIATAPATNSIAWDFSAYKEPAPAPELASKPAPETPPVNVALDEDERRKRRLALAQRL